MYEILGLIIIFCFPVVLVGVAFLNALGKRPGFRRRRSRNVEVERRCPHREDCKKSGNCVLDPADCPSAVPFAIKKQKVNLRFENTED